MYEETLSIGLQQESKTGHEGSLYVMWDVWGDEGGFMYETSKQRHDRYNDTTIIREATRHKMQTRGLVQGGERIEDREQEEWTKHTKQERKPRV